ncbi:MAG: TdeIII family type II restriction endonuclease [Gammaproteobacteria bacterium]|nr:TdeIII family type II restriction endonuclease [Gammaproteobacteria bacterium]
MLNTQKIEQIIENTLRKKMTNYSPKAEVMPFHTSLIGQDRMALYSFIQSCNTTFGSSILEPVAKEVARGHFDKVETQHKIGDKFSKKAQSEIADIISELTTGRVEPDHNREVAKIRNCCQSGQAVPKVLPLADVFLSKGNQVFLIDMKTVKPNKASFESYKQTLLEWVAAVLYNNPEKDVRAMIAIPYNPFDPKPYAWWPKKKMLETGKQLKIAEEFWNFLAGGDNVYDELLNCFERVGVRLRGEIDAHFQKFGAADHAKKNAEVMDDESEKAKCPNCGETRFSMVSENKETVCFVIEGGELVPDVMESEYLCYDMVTCTACDKVFDVSELESDDV